MRFIKIDFTVQTILIILVGLLFVVSLFTGGVNHVGPIGSYGVLLLGAWQVVSSAVTIFSKGSQLKGRRIHLLTSLAYLAFIALFSPDDGPIKFVVVGLPVLLVLFCYYVTLRSYQQARA